MLGLPDAYSNHCGVYGRKPFLDVDRYKCIIFMCIRRNKLLSFSSRQIKILNHLSVMPVVHASVVPLPLAPPAEMPDGFSHTPDGRVAKEVFPGHVDVVRQ